MRWENLSAPPDPGIPEGAAPAAPPLPLALPGTVARTFDTPAFAGMTFYEVHAKSIINRVPNASRTPFKWTINPYRGCTHKCVYCFARNTHRYLDLDPGRDFDTKVIVKVNAGDLIRKELAAPRLLHRLHRRETVALRRGRHPQPTPAARRRPHADRGRFPGRSPDGTDSAGPHRHRRVD